jgi:hypothetical protein
MTGDEIGMEVREEDVPDFESELCRIGKVLLDIALRVDNDRRETRLISQQIRRVSKAAQVVLFQNHARFSFLR